MVILQLLHIKLSLVVLKADCTFACHSASVCGRPEDCNYLW